MYFLHVFFVAQMDTFSISLEMNTYLNCTMLFNVC